MARWLYLIRHAQSAERQSSQQDVERDLTTTGRKEAAAIAHFFKKNNYQVDLIVSSAAIRAESTSKLIHGILNLDQEIILFEELYQASVRNLLEFTNKLDDEFKNIALVGHNPYISYFAEHLTKADIGNMDPASVVSIRFEISNWNEVSEGSGSMENYIRPSSLE